MGGRKEEGRMPYNSGSIQPPATSPFHRPSPLQRCLAYQSDEGGEGASPLSCCAPHILQRSLRALRVTTDTAQKDIYFNKSHFSERTQARARLPVLAGFLFHVTTPWCFLPSITTHGRVMVPLSRLKKPRIPISRCCLLTSRMHRRREQRKTSVQTQSVFRAQARAF